MLTREKFKPPETLVGDVLFVVVPSPSCPVPLSPQQYAAPLTRRPHIEVSPASIEEKVRPPETATGESLCVLVPSPTSPDALRPQQ
jgi:hypothetical protein